MIDEELCESDKSSMELLKYIFSDWENFLKEIAPDGWEKSQYRCFLHPTPEKIFGELPNGHPQKSINANFSLHHF